MDIKEQIHELSEEMLNNLGRLVAIDSQLGTPAEGMPFGEGPAKALEEGLKIADELGFKTVNLDNYCGYAEMGDCLLYTSPSPRDTERSRMPSSA